MPSPQNNPGQGESRPGTGGNPGSNEQPNEGPSRPKDPNNDPDQTPVREVRNPPKADPSTGDKR